MSDERMRNGVRSFLPEGMLVDDELIDAYVERYKGAHGASIAALIKKAYGGGASDGEAENG